MTRPLPTNMDEAEEWIATAVEDDQSNELGAGDEDEPEFTAIDDLVRELRGAGNDELANGIVKQYDLDW